MLFVMPDLKKFAKEKGMTISKTFVYGEYDGYMLCIAEGYGIKVLSISCKINDNENVLKFFKEIKILKKFHVEKYEITTQGIQLFFVERLTALPKLKKFLNVFIPLLKENGVSGTQICAECSEDINDKETKLVIKNGFVHKVHSDCAQKLIDKVEETKETIKEKNNVIRGTIGALLCAILGGIIFWFITLVIAPKINEYVDIFLILMLLVVIAIFTGLAMFKSYHLFGGKVCKAEFVSLSVGAVLGYIIGYPLKSLLHILVLTPVYFVKKDLPFEIKGLCSKFVEVIISFFREDRLYIEPVFWAFVGLGAIFTFAGFIDSVLASYLMLDLKLLKVSKILE